MVLLKDAFPLRRDAKQCVSARGIILDRFGAEQLKSA